MHHRANWSNCASSVFRCSTANRTSWPIFRIPCSVSDNCSVPSRRRSKLSELASRYRNRPLVRVFYQVWDRPLYTLNGRHIVSDAIRLCGGENIFAQLPVIAPRVDIEAVLQQDPEAIISGSRPERSDDGLGIWKPYPTLQAVRLGNLFAVNGDLLNRPGPRMIAGAAALCETLEQARQRRGEKK
jgi:iron complex transport system substrate-binding protein